MFDIKSLKLDTVEDPCAKDSLAIGHLCRAKTRQQAEEEGNDGLESLDCTLYEWNNESCSVQRWFNAIGESIGSCLLAQSSQADTSRNCSKSLKFSAWKMMIIRYHSVGCKTKLFDFIQIFCIEKNNSTSWFMLKSWFYGSLTCCYDALRRYPKPHLSEYRSYSDAK